MNKPSIQKKPSPVEAALLMSSIGECKQAMTTAGEGYES